MNASCNNCSAITDDFCLVPTSEKHYTTTTTTTAAAEMVRNSTYSILRTGSNYFLSENITDGSSLLIIIVSVTGGGIFLFAFTFTIIFVLLSIYTIYSKRKNYIYLSFNQQVYFVLQREKS